MASWSTIIATICLIWYCLLWAFGFVGWRFARKRYGIRPRSPLSSAAPETVPGVSILRPLKGLDSNLFENLESTCIQQYPKFEIIFSVADEDDQALTVVRELLQKYPAVDVSVIVGEEVVGVNPKVNNLMQPYKTAKYDILWVLDSNVLVDPGTLGRSVDTLLQAQRSSTSSPRPVIGLVHHVPFAYPTERAFGSRVESAFLNTNHAKMYIALNYFAFDSCVTGKSSMYRRSDLRRVNADLKRKPPAPNDDEAERERDGYGLAAFGRYMSEDNMIGAAIWHELGMRHDLSCDVAQNAIGRMSFMDYVWRRVRWIRVRKKMVLAATILEPLTESVVVGLLASWGMRTLFGVPFWVSQLVHFSAWLTMDLAVYKTLAGHPVPQAEQWPLFCAWVVRELCALPIWALAICGGTVIWRGTRYEIESLGRARRLDDEEPSKKRVGARRDGYESLSQEA